MSSFSDAILSNFYDQGPVINFYSVDSVEGRESLDMEVKILLNRRLSQVQDECSQKLASDIRNDLKSYATKLSTSEVGTQDASPESRKELQDRTATNFYDLENRASVRTPLGPSSTDDRIQEEERAGFAKSQALFDQQLREGGFQTLAIVGSAAISDYQQLPSGDLTGRRRLGSLILNRVALIEYAGKPLPRSSIPDYPTFRGTGSLDTGPYSREGRTRYVAPEATSLTGQGRDTSTETNASHPPLSENEVGTAASGSCASGSAASNATSFTSTRHLTMGKWSEDEVEMKYSMDCRNDDEGDSMVRDEHVTWGTDHGPESRKYG
ncbi:hypothetical protein BCR39DRAFT_599217 [Naematelia encephala]|uniref:Uncharacterized protein n=1 Tax=Naematelia encephala TaxID=71784 RepID=A0A1Y2AZG9_9TREE|nr:hypothetical protein BCR39DRAFT_599217 [Naematelia encephala]